MSMVTSLMRMAAPRSEVSAPVGNRRHASADRASYYMLQLYRTNLEVRLQCIDQETLSAHQQQIYAKIAERLQAPVHDWDTDAGLEWDETYKLERLIALLFNGAQLRQEVAHRLTELADKNVPEATSFRYEYQAMAAAPAHNGQPPIGDDGVLRAFVL